MRPIDADALKAILERYRECNSALVDDYSDGKFEAYSLSIAEINDAPTIDTDRPHGKWLPEFVHHGVRYHKCDVCKISTMVGNINYYCPNCGADMREEGDEK